MTKFQKAKRFALIPAASVAALVASPAAFAQAIAAPDVSSGVSFIEGLLTPIGLLGAAFLVVSIAIKGWKIMRSV